MGTPDSGRSDTGTADEWQSGSLRSPSTLDKRNHLATCIESGTRRMPLRLQIASETLACSSDIPVGPFLDSRKFTLLSQPGKYLHLYEKPRKVSNTPTVYRKRNLYFDSSYLPDVTNLHLLFSNIETIALGEIRFKCSGGCGQKTSSALVKDCLVTGPPSGTLKHERAYYQYYIRRTKRSRISSSVSRCSIIRNTCTPPSAMTPQPSSKRGRQWLN